MKVPFFTLSNYSDIMNSHHDNQSTNSWIDFWDFLVVMKPNFVQSYADLDARQVGAYIAQHNISGTCEIAGQQCNLSDGLVLCKLLCPTLHRCNYFFWDTGHGTHLGLDIIMPQGSPIISVADGTVIEVHHRDGVKQDEGNHIVIRGDDGYVVAYEHLDSMHVTVGQYVHQGHIIAGCGTTGYSTQYHLHLQVDRPTAPFFPYRHESGVGYAEHTVDALRYLQSISPYKAFVDMPGGDFDLPINNLYREGIVQGYERKVFPHTTLKRYEMALLIDRVCKKYDMYNTLPIDQSSYHPYADVGTVDVELISSLIILQKYGIMKGHDGKFYPNKALAGEECLALLGRIFYGLQDNNSSPWREDYKNTFILKGLIDANWKYIGSPILRQEIFALLWRLLDQRTVTKRL